MLLAGWAEAVEAVGLAAAVAAGSSRRPCRAAGPWRGRSMGMAHQARPRQLRRGGAGGGDARQKAVHCRPGAPLDLPLLCEIRIEGRWRHRCSWWRERFGGRDGGGTRGGAGRRRRGVGGQRKQRRLLVISELLQDLSLHLACRELPQAVLHAVHAVHNARGDHRCRGRPHGPIVRKRERKPQPQFVLCCCCCCLASYPPLLTILPCGGDPWGHPGASSRRSRQNKLGKSVKSDLRLHRWCWCVS